MSRLTGKVAIVTGASKGIGAQIARELAAAGAAVVVNYAGSRAGAESVVAAITGAGGKAIAVQADVAKLPDVQRLVAEAIEAFGSPDILVNNAGVYEMAPLEAITAEHFHRQFDTNVLGLLQVTQEVARHIGPKGGSIVNISSVVSQLKLPGLQRVCGNQGGGGSHHARARQGAGTAQDPCQLRQPGPDRDRGHPLPGNPRQRF